MSLVSEFRLGRWQDVMADVETCDVLLTDPPYSERTHKGERGLRFNGTTEPNGARCPRSAIAYESIDALAVTEAVVSWAPRVANWALTFSDHTSFRLWEAAWSSQWYAFGPVVYLKANAPPRFAGDGPASCAEYLCVSRPRRRVRDSGSRPGHYSAIAQVGRGGGAVGVVGVKDVATLCRILADYTRPGDLVCDPFGGTATVGAACKATGRNYIGCEVDPATHAIGMERLKNTQETPEWSWPDRWKDKHVEQGVLI